MRANLAGRVRNTSLPKTHPLLPLFEAVVNSVDAIDEAGLPLDRGSVTVMIKRQSTLALETDGASEDRSRSPIRSFHILDNGIGFTESNYQAFNEADTQVKAPRGGRGVGRFMWLKAFESVHVDSSFNVDDRSFRRTFTFSLQAVDGIIDHALVPLPQHAPPQTEVQLLDFKEEYERLIPRAAQTIAHRLLEHFLEYYVLTKMPPVTLHDEAEDHPILLDTVYDSLVESTVHNTIALKDHTFDIGHFFLRSTPGLSHRLNYCANGRVVVSERVSGKVPNLPASLPTDTQEGNLTYVGYVSGDYLDAHVNHERTGFDTVPEGSQMFPGELTWSQIEEGVIHEARGVLARYTDEVKRAKEKRIREYVATRAPEYRHIVKHHSERLDSIPPDAPDEKLPLHLYAIQHDIEVQLKHDVSEILQPAPGEDVKPPSDQDFERLSNYWDELNEMGKANLAKYIVHRKYVLSILDAALKRTHTGKYSREEIIHRIVFPLKATSDDIGFDQHNLWLLDEKLAYHRYLASDLALSKVETLESQSDSRPDLLFFFGNAFATADDVSPYNAGIVIFEFKRPMRDDFADEDNPIQQVLGYVEDIKAGKKVDKDGRPFRANQATPFFCYIVADLTDTLRQQARYHDLHQTPDGLGFFGYNEGIGAYLEIFDFDKLVQDSKKRNRVLFEKLNLPDTLI